MAAPQEKDLHLTILFSWRHPQLNMETSLRALHLRQLEEDRSIFPVPTVPYLHQADTAPTCYRQ